MFFLEGNKAAVFSIILIKYINSLTLQRVYYCCFIFLEREIKLQSTDRTRWLLISGLISDPCSQQPSTIFSCSFFFETSRKGTTIIKPA